jgi:hypothetical protein
LTTRTRSQGASTKTISIGASLTFNNVPGNRVQKTAQAVGCGPPDMSGCDGGQCCARRELAVQPGSGRSLGQWSRRRR